MILLRRLSNSVPANSSCVNVAAFWRGRASHVSEEKGVAGEDGVVLSVFVDEEVGGAFHRVAGRVQDLDGDVTDLQQFAVFGDVRVKRSVGVGAVDDGRTGFFGERDVPTDEVGVEMRLEDVLDLDPIAAARSM